MRGTQTREVSLDGGHGAEMALPCLLGTLFMDLGVLALPIPTLGHERLIVPMCQPGRR